MFTLARPIHPNPGNCSINQALRLEKLYHLFTSDAGGGVPFFTCFFAQTYVQGDTLWIPYKSFAELYPPPEGGAKEGPGKRLNPDAARYGIDVDALMSGPDSDISLVSEATDPNIPLAISMHISVWPNGSPNHNVLPGGKDKVTVDAGGALINFDSNRKAHGVQSALHDLGQFPCDAFKVADAGMQLAAIASRVVGQQDINKLLEALPGVLS